jgi:hypothetical protein
LSLAQVSSRPLASQNPQPTLARCGAFAASMPGLRRRNHAGRPAAVVRWQSTVPPTIHTAKPTRGARRRPLSRGSAPYQLARATALGDRGRVWRGVMPSSSLDGVMASINILIYQVDARDLSHTPFFSWAAGIHHQALLTPAVAASGSEHEAKRARDLCIQRRSPITAWSPFLLFYRAHAASSVGPARAV